MDKARLFENIKLFVMCRQFKMQAYIPENNRPWTWSCDSSVLMHRCAKKKLERP